MNKLLLPFLATLALAGCDSFSTFSEGLEQSQSVASDLEKSVGAKPFVGFNWSNGSLVNVSITFQGIPKEKPIQDIAALSQQSIKKYFKQEPKQVVLSFSIETK